MKIVTEIEIGTMLDTAEKGCVSFRKQNGDIREMRFSRDFSKAELKGTGAKFDAKEKHLTPVIDLDLPEGRNIRSVKWDSIIRLEVGDDVVTWNPKNKVYENVPKSK